MKILALCIGRREPVPGKSYKSGINKTAVSGPVSIDKEGLLGDAVCNKKYHGGPDQAVYIEGGESLAWWAEALGQALPPGRLGENLVIEGLDNSIVAVGDRFIAGEVILEAAAPRGPCSTLSAAMGDPSIVARYMKAGRPGIYCRVIATGTAEAGTEVSYHPYAQDRVMIADLIARPSRWSPELRQRALAAPIASRLRADIEAFMAR